MNPAFQDAFYFLGVSLAYIVAFLLFRSPVGDRATNRLLGITFFCMGWYNMIYLLTLTGLFTKVYWLAGWGPSLGLLVSPCAFLYVRQSLTNTSNLERRDWVHFLPFLLSFLDLLPFNLGFYMDKAAYVSHAVNNYNQFYQQKISLIPLRVHFIVRPIQALGYLFFQWQLLVRAKSKKGRIYRWLIAMTALQTFVYGVLMLLTIRGFSTGQGIYVAKDFQTLMFIMYVAFFLASVILMFYPDALYGLPTGDQRETGPVHAEALEAIFSDIEEPALAEEEKSAPEVRPVNEKIISRYLPVIETYIQQTQPYLQPKMSIQDMAVATRIPLHHLSYIINQHYKVRYTDLMNQYRVDHAKSLIARGVWKELSLEGLGKKSGFANRTNFFLVFKKSTGLSPSDYLQAVKAGRVAPGNG